MKTDDKIVTFESYYDPMLAHIMRTKLQANGIECFIADENTTSANPLYNQAVGGVKLKIFERDIQKCREILAANPGLNEDGHAEINAENALVVCPYCASADVVSSADKDNGFLSSLVNQLNPFYTRNNWHCNNCQHDFE